MHKRMFCCDWQKQQNLSQVHFSSVLSHCMQRTGPLIRLPGNFQDVANFGNYRISWYALQGAWRWGFLGAIGARCLQAIS
jgi:hypothetical protein